MRLLQFSVRHRRLADNSRVPPCRLLLYELDRIAFDIRMLKVGYHQGSWAQPRQTFQPFVLDLGYRLNRRCISGLNRHRLVASYRATNPRVDEAILDIRIKPVAYDFKNVGDYD